MRPSLKEFKDVIGSRVCTALELGVCDGKNAKIIHETLRCMRLYLIDAWNPTYSTLWSEWLIKTCEIFSTDKRVIIIKANGIEASILIPNESIDYLYIDAAHDYGSVLKDINLYYSKVKPGGMVAGHDYTDEHPERVKAAVHDVFGNKAQHRELDWWVWK